MRIIRQPQIRFEHSYSGVLTVLEGAKLSKLLESFFKHFREERKETTDFLERLFYSVLRSYESVHGKEVVSYIINTLEDTGNVDADADTRKLDLFYRGMLRSFAEVAHPDEDWNTIFEEQKTYKDIAKEVVSSNPNVFKKASDLNKLIRQIQDDLKKS